MDEKLEKALKSAKGSIEAEGITVSRETVEEIRERFKIRNDAMLEDIKKLNKRVNSLVSTIEENIKSTNEIVKEKQKKPSANDG